MVFVCAMWNMAVMGFTYSLKGGFPQAISMIVHPKLQISAYLP